MKKSFSPYRTPSTPFAGVPYTEGIVDFLKGDKMPASLAKSTILSKNSHEFRKSPLNKELEVAKSGIRSTPKSPTNASNKNLAEGRPADQGLARLVREIVKEQLSQERRRMVSGQPYSGQLKKNPFKEVGDLRRELKELSKRLQTQKEDRVKVIEGLWHCFSDKLEHASCLRESEEASTEQIRQHINQSLTAADKRIDELAETLNSQKQELAEIARGLRQEATARFVEKNSQMQVVISSIEHLNVLIKEMGTEQARVRDQLNNRMDEVHKMSANSRQSADSEELDTFRQRMKAEMLLYRRASSEELRESLEKVLQDCETDRLNMKSRLKKLETAVRIATSSEESRASFEEAISKRIEGMAQIYNSNFEHLERAQGDIAQTVNGALEAIKDLTRNLATFRESTEYSLRNSQTELASLRNTFVSLTENKLQSELDAVKGSISGFQLESRKVLPREKSSELLPTKSAKNLKSDLTLSENCSSSSSLGTELSKQMLLEKRRLTGETIDTLEGAEKTPTNKTT